MALDRDGGSKMTGVSSESSVSQHTRERPAAILTNSRLRSVILDSGPRARGLCPAATVAEHGDQSLASPNARREDGCPASAMNPEPVTPAAPLDVSISTPSTVSSWPNVRSMPETCARKIVAGIAVGCELRAFRSLPRAARCGCELRAGSTNRRGWWHQLAACSRSEQPAAVC